MIRILATLLGVVAAGVAVVGLVARYLPLGRHSSLLLATASPYLTLAAPVAVLLLILSRRWVLTALTVGLTLAVGYVHAPQYIGQEFGPQSAAPASSPVRVLSSNLGMGRGDPAAVVAAARRSADVVVLQELTQEAADGLAAAGLDTTFGHRIIDPQPMAGGIGIWSRFPLTDTAHVPGYSLAMVRARVQLPDVAVAPVLVGIHFAAPWPQPVEPWRTDMEKFPTMLRELVDEAGPGAVIVAGDFNATHDMLPFRELLATGYRDAAEQAGGGMVRTFPAGPRRVPAVGIDHVLLRNADATAVRTELIPGADHLALIADVLVPQGG
ncbi:endonuclease/exonuclease/phosphatase family protein [Mycolicibacterium houstonense]|uniref:endonuclease/exonuclease/phosphatase family protein n=1 Tax=Mycolicibacterium houstonense TaxID=146021 RepID=UPI0008378792|nr:endonuclease/exonuclease/phosphatase family protein [Mycolicibacterium houstonense]